MIMTRFLQALWTQKHAVHEVPMPPSAKIVHFVIITRHPIATALAHAVYPDCKMMTLLELVMHWIAQHQTMALDVKHLDSVTHIQYEELVRNPDCARPRRLDRSTVSGIAKGAGLVGNVNVVMGRQPYIQL